MNVGDAFILEVQLNADKILGRKISSSLAQEMTICDTQKQIRIFFLDWLWPQHL